MTNLDDLANRLVPADPMNIIKKETALGILRTIRHELWLIDISSPGDCPEYQEHHKQVQSVMKTVDFWIKKVMEMS